MFFTKYITGALGILLALSIASGYLYYEYASNKIDKLNKEVQLLSDINDANQIAIKKLRQNIENYTKLNKELQQKNSDAENYVDELRKKFRTRSLTTYSKQKFNEAEQRINAATAKLFREIENETKVTNTIK